MTLVRDKFFTDGVGDGGGVRWFPDDSKEPKPRFLTGAVHSSFQAFMQSNATTDLTRGGALAVLRFAHLTATHLLLYS